MSSGFMLEYPANGLVRHYPLHRQLFCIGNNPGNDCCIDDATLPPIAIRIEPEGKTFRCTQAGAMPLFINGKKGKSALLSPGHRIHIGNHHFTYLDSPPPASSLAGSADEALGNLQAFIDAVGNQRQLEPLLRSMRTSLLERTGATECILLKLDERGSPHLSECGGDKTGTLHFSDTIVRSVIETGQAVCCNDTFADPLCKNAPSVADLKLRAILCVPIVSAGKCMGVIYLGSEHPATFFTGVDIAIVKVCAAITGMLLHHVEFIAEQQKTILQLSASDPDDSFVAGSTAMRKVITAVDAIADTAISVLITGETGTGKNRIAERIHCRSGRRDGPFVIVNCSALRGELLESELFGHRKGSFTGAVADHEGLFVAADGGTLLFDEIGELELPLQAKLLRALDTGMVRPVGATTERTVRVRALFATNRNMAEMVKERAFRSDLYYRINQFSVNVPALRERGNDGVIIAGRILEKLCRCYPDKLIRGFHPDALVKLRTYSWPGNIREMDNCIHRSVLLGTGPLIDIDIEESSTGEPCDFEEACRLFQRKILAQTIERAGGNKDLAARMLNLSRSTLYRYLSHCELAQ